MSATTGQRPDRRLDHSVFDADIEGQAMNLHYLRRIFGWMRPHWQTAAMSVALVLVASALAILLPVIITRVIIDGVLIGDVDVTLPDFGMRALNAWLARVAGWSPLASACALYAMLTVVCHGCYHLHRITFARSVLSALRDLRRDLFAHMERRPSSFFDKVAVGRVMTRITNDVQALFEMLMGIGMLIGEFLPFLLAMFIMLSIDAELTGYLLMALPVFALVTYFFRQATRRIYRHIRMSVSRLNQNLQENLAGMQVVQLSNREARNLEAYRDINDENRRQEIDAVKIESGYGAFMDNMVNMALAVIIWVGGGAAVQGAISLGSVILFTQFVDMLIRPIRVLGQQYNILFRAMASAERIFQALDWQEHVHEPAAPVDLPARLAGKLEFRGLSFGYSPDEPVLHDVSLTVRPGETLAVVGPTGSGKSTLIRLLGRFYDVPDGTVFIDDIDVNRIRSHDLRSRIGVVPQDFHIFSGTVLDNIRLGNARVSAERAMEAARLVHADGFIDALPDGYQTHLVERGQNLSQGQRQLLAFARVLAADPEILILDEATASIDTETEQIIREALATVTAGRTSILIAHRLQTIRSADRILVLKHGKVKEIGTHDELLERRGVYYTLHQLQFQDVAVAG